MTGQAHNKQPQLRTLQPEAWGDRMRRARDRRPVNAVEERISRIVPVGRNTIVRLERMQAPPTDRRRRLIAVLALLSYGIDPRDLGFDPAEDLPSGLDEKRCLDVLDPQSACNTDNWAGLFDLVQSGHSAA